MQIEILKSKIHRAIVTEANINYIGSITIDESLMEAAHIIAYEKVHVVNISNGERIVTYVMKGKRDSGIICLNGAAARKATTGDIIIILSYAMMTPEEAESYTPICIFPENNQI
jgi:aspartate 1-decarboxylase